MLFPFTYRPTALHANKKVVHVVSQQEFKAEDLPDLNCQEVAKAAVQIQKVYRGFQTRKQIKQSNDDLPDLKSKDVADAAVKIQAVYRYEIVYIFSNFSLFFFSFLKNAPQSIEGAEVGANNLCTFMQ